MKRPTLGAMIAGRLRPIKRTFALAPVEASEMPARERYPDDAFLVDVAAANPEPRQRHSVDFRKRRLRGIRTRSDPHDSPWKRPRSAPYRTVHGARHHGVETR